MEIVLEPCRTYTQYIHSAGHLPDSEVETRVVTTIARAKVIEAIVLAGVEGHPVELQVLSCHEFQSCVFLQQVLCLLFLS